jgi:elongation factor Ts
MSFDPRNRPASPLAGAIESYIHAGGKIGVLVELGCESDFVARTEEFSELMHDIAGINSSNRHIFIGRGVWPFVY